MTQKHTHKKETDEIYECESLSQVRHEHITAARTYNYSLCNLCVTFILISKMFTKAASVFTCEGVRRRVIVGFNPHAARGRVSRARWQLKQQVVSFPRCVFYSGWCSVRWDVHSQQHSTRQEKKEFTNSFSHQDSLCLPNRADLGFNLRCSNLLKTRQLGYYTLYKCLLDLYLRFLAN